MDLTVFYNNDYVASRYAFDTTRKAQAIAQSLANDPIEGVHLADPAATGADTEAVLRELHEGRYFEAVRTGTPRGLAQRQGFDWDPGIFTMAVAHAHGLVRAAEVALGGNTRSGSLSSGLHHASRSQGAGYCTFNGLAAAAVAANRAGAGRVLLLDFDAHCGGGTFDILGENSWFTQVDVSTSMFDVWEPTGDHYLRGVGTGSYVDAIGRALDHAGSLGAYDLVIYNAGMDPINTGVSTGHVLAREQMVSEFIGGTPAVFALAGGYTWGHHTMDDLVTWHRMTIDTWAAC